VEGILRTNLFWRSFLAAVCFAVSTASTLEARPALVFDAEDGRVLFAEQADTPWYPASLTKLMTAYVIFDMLKRGEITPTSEFVISPHANSQPKSRVGWGVGKRINVKDALQGLIIHSANDLAVGLAEAVSGSEEEFVIEMNQVALRLGMLHTQFVNANGLPKEGQATTARDMGLLARAIIQQFPEWSALFAQTSAQIGRHNIHTHNRLLDHFDGADGMKTGFTCGAGYNIVASATRSGRRIVAVVLGEKSGDERTTRAKTLLEAGFASAPGQSIDATILAPQTVDGKAIVAASAFVPAQNLSEVSTVRKCFAQAGPSTKLVQEIEAREKAPAKPGKKQAKK
jgi:D-alanyl-D-alanine carboxypeptidase